MFEILFSVISILFCYILYIARIGVGRSDVLPLRLIHSFFFFYTHNTLIALYLRVLKFHLKIPCTLFFLFFVIPHKNYSFQAKLHRRIALLRPLLLVDLKWKQRIEKMSCYLITPHLFCVWFFFVCFFSWILFHSFTWCCFCFNVMFKACIYRIIVSHACIR